MTTPPLLVVRADASAEIGSGHVMRCLALGQAWADRGGAVRFVGDLDPTSAARVVAEGFAFTALDARHPAPTDASILRGVLAEAPAPPALIVDGYSFDPGYLAAVRPGAGATLALDDLSELPRYPCDLVLNSSFADAALYGDRVEGRVLGGPRFAPIRRELARAAATSRAAPRDGAAPLRVLLTFGGSDPAGGTEPAMRAATLLPRERFVLRAVVGGANRRADELRALAAELGVEVVVGATDLSPHFAWADLAVAATGSTSWELALFGVPAIAVIAAENQRPIANGMVTRGAARLLGALDAITPGATARAIEAFAAAPGALAEARRRALDVVDGEGAARVCDALQAAWAERVPLSLRRPRRGQR